MKIDDIKIGYEYYLKHRWGGGRSTSPVRVLAYQYQQINNPRTWDGSTYVAKYSDAEWEATKPLVVGGVEYRVPFYLQPRNSGHKAGADPHILIVGENAVGQKHYSIVASRQIFGERVEVDTAEATEKARAVRAAEERRIREDAQRAERAAIAADLRSLVDITTTSRINDRVLDSWVDSGTSDPVIRTAYWAVKEATAKSRKPARSETSLFV